MQALKEKIEMKAIPINDVLKISNPGQGTWLAQVQPRMQAELVHSGKMGLPAFPAHPQAPPRHIAVRHSYWGFFWMIRDCFPAISPD